MLDALNIAVAAFLLLLLPFAGKDLRWSRRPWFVKAKTVPRRYVAIVVASWLVAAIVHAS